MVNYKITEAVMEDLEPLIKIWNKNNSVLGRYFKTDLIQQVEEKRLLVAKLEDGTLIGFCGMILKKKKFVLEIDGICILEEYRGCGIGKAFIERLKTYGRPIELECVDGAENNKFYDRVGKLVGTRMSKSGTMKLRQYRIDNGYKTVKKASLI
jgi:GNAT superfamily N-acetyltransferase